MIYTSLMGDYIPLAPMIDLNVPCIAFCDQNYAATGWEVRVVHRPEPHPRLRAKYFKMHPHELFPDYDVSVWIDAGVIVLDKTFPNKIAAWLKGAATVFFPHRQRRTVKEELAAHLVIPKYAGLPLKEQVAHYTKQGFPDDVGLLECTVIARYHNDFRAVRLNEKWWTHNVRWSFADQLSLPYCIWQLGGDAKAGVTRLPFAINVQPWVKWETSRMDK